MNEIERRRALKGLGGWLVLFQIHIFSTLAQTVQMILLFIVSGILLRSEFISEIYSDVGFNPFELYSIMNSPVTFILLAAVFVLMLLCIIYFYRKKLVFRRFFIMGSAINIAALCIFIYFMMRWFNGAYTQMVDGFAPFGGMFTVFYLLFSILPAVGIVVALIIALYKSYRVKNTFS